MRTRRTFTAAVTWLAAATTAACSSSGSTDSGGTPTSPPSPTESSQAWSPTGELAYVSLPADPDSKDYVSPVLHTIHADGTGEKNLRLATYAATWSHDGTRLLANAIPESPLGPWRPGVVDPRGRVHKQFALADQPDEIWNCHWTPNEKAAVCAIGGIVRIDLATQKATRLTTGHDQVWDVSRDGRIAFVHQVAEGDNEEDVQLFTVGVDGSGLYKLTDWGELDGNYDDAGGSWLPDGSAIVAATPTGQLVSVDATTGALTPIPLDEPLAAGHPDVSPDGTQIAFQSPPTGGDIYATPIDGGPVALVIGTGADELRAEWRPSA